MPDMSSSSNISWFPLTPGLFDVDYDGVSVIVDDVLRAGNLTGYSEYKHASSSSLTAGYSFAGLNLSSGIDHFFRLAVSSEGRGFG